MIQQGSRIAKYGMSRIWGKEKMENRRKKITPPYSPMGNFTLTQSLVGLTRYSLFTD